MRYARGGGLALGLILALSSSAWTQGGSGRGAAAQTAAAQGAPSQQAAQAGRGGGRGSGGGADGLYAFDATAPAGMAIVDSQPVETRQKLNVNGEALAYTARAGVLPLRNATTGQAAAHVFFTSYSRDGAADAARPLVVFLGGAPGVSAAWQDFGGFGPKRVKAASDGASGPPYTWVDNGQTLLTDADLVFANPVGTAFSRPDQPSRAAEFWTTAGDTASMGEFVRGYLAQYDRRHAPLILAGEDYGTGRAAAVALYLIERQVPVAGIALLSITPSADSIAGDEQYITLLPSQVLAAWHHKKLSPDLQALGVDQIAEQARAFAAREYLHALYKGDRMTADERTRVVGNLSRLTGLSKAFVLNNDLRVSLDRFSAELLRDQHRAIAVSDVRVSGFLPGTTGGGRGGFGGGAGPGVDYAQYNVGAGFLAAYETYLRRELNVTTTPGSVFYLSGGGVGSYASTGSDEASLAAAFVRNPRLRVFVGMSLFDLAVPFYAADFTVAHLNVAPEVHSRNIALGHYEAGQMPYMDSRARAKLRGDLAKFITETAAAARQ
jgi:carboxypeptidase C (cathepsin A)